METKEYIVILQDGIDYNSVWDDIENPTIGLPHIPDRAVSILNNQDSHPRLCHYALTAEEVELLKLDPRVLDAHRIPEEIGLFSIPPTTFGPSTANVTFNIPAYNVGNLNNINWGLIRHSYDTNVYGNTVSTIKEYNYMLDGTGVDIVAMDTGIEYYHPEFQDASGNTRIVLYNWTGNLNTTPNSINFSDTDGHGTSAAAVAAGKTFGWAKNAAIYPCKITTGGTGGITPYDGLTAVLNWHNAKNTIGNPAYTGRPTVVMAEFYNALIPSKSLTLNVQSINYHGGGNVAAVAPDPAKGMGPANSQVPCYDLPSNTTVNLTTGQPYRITATDTKVQDLINAGIIFIAAAGNNAHKIAAPNDPDYNNYWNGNVVISGITYPVNNSYYNRGATPAIANSIVVGAMAVGENNSGKNYKASFSNAGYTVDIYAAGWDVRTAISNINVNTSYGEGDYYANTSFRQVNFTGTSAALPQVVGMAALYLQSHPLANNRSSNNCATVKSWLTYNANTSALYSSGSSIDYTNYQSQWGGAGGVAYQPIQGIIKSKIGVNTWQATKNIKSKTAENTWSNAKAVYVKTGPTTWTQVY